VIRQIRHWKSEHGIPLNSDLNYVGIITTTHQEVLNNIIKRILFKLLKPKISNLPRTLRPLYLCVALNPFIQLLDLNLKVRAKKSYPN
jgi:hypothetical protein